MVKKDQRPRKHHLRHSLKYLQINFVLSALLKVFFPHFLFFLSSTILKFFLLIEVEWSASNKGIILCIECSGIHRSLGVQISKVKSLCLDDWPSELISVQFSFLFISFCFFFFFLSFFFSFFDLKKKYSMLQ